MIKDQLGRMKRFGERRLVGRVFCSFEAEVYLVVILSKGQLKKELVLEFS